MTRWAFLDHPGPLPFAHRGGACERPENTMAAFEHAVRLGYRYVETDVRATADGVAVIFHDERLDRLTELTGRIAERRWAELSPARVNGLEPVPRLDDLLGAWPHLRVNIDPKHDAAVAPLVEVLERTRAHGRVCVGASSDRRLASFRRLSGGWVCTSMGRAEIARLRLASYGARPGRLAAACVQVPVRHRRLPVVDPRFIAAAHRRGLQVHVWTIDDASEMDRLLDLGVDGIMTDRPTLLREVLRRRGQWA
ncbi:MAG: glycerophosphodiester phosphodiesterase [Actinomycetota bacterium]